MVSVFLSLRSCFKFATVIVFPAICPTEKRQLPRSSPCSSQPSHSQMMSFYLRPPQRTDNILCDFILPRCQSRARDCVHFLTALCDGSFFKTRHALKRFPDFDLKPFIVSSAVCHELQKNCTCDSCLSAILSNEKWGPSVCLL